MYNTIVLTMLVQYTVPLVLYNDDCGRGHKCELRHDGILFSLPQGAGGKSCNTVLYQRYCNNTALRERDSTRGAVSKGVLYVGDAAVKETLVDSA